MSNIPKVSLAVSVSPNTVTPIITAVRGSSAPIIAVGVDPNSLTAIVIVTSDIMVGTNASIKAYNQEEDVVSI